MDVSSVKSPKCRRAPSLQFTDNDTILLIFFDGWQEIDGLALLLMKWNDVARLFGLQLGPAVKIYTLVRHLQNRYQDSTLSC